MELIETSLSDFTRRSRSLSVRHADTRLSRGLEYGERVLVRSGAEYRTAVVADVEFSTEDTHYRLVLGGTVPAEVAEARLLGEISVTPEDRDKSWVSVEEIATLLSRAGSAHRIPMQRQVARRLLDR
jgi:phage terminase large subunit-like protein